jgi:phospholipid-binding lipoprotein MlaA
LGIAGMIDVASEFGLTPVDEDFGQTLAVWGVGDGAYLMLPVLGPSSVRDGIGRGVDIFLNPLTYLFTNTDTEYVGAIMSVTDGLDQRSRNIEVLDDIERTSVDFYAAIRSLYRQARQDLIYNGETTG